MAEITCQHCSRTVPSKRPKQQKWCPRCRALKAIVALRERTNECMGCGGAFHGFSRADTLCPGCESVALTPAQPLQRPCAFCGTRGPAIKGLDPGDLDLCSTCATEPEGHPLVVRSAITKLRELVHS